MNICDSRQYITKIMSDRFKNKTFGRYIRETLAGDFACEIAAVLKGFEEEIESRESQSQEAYVRALLEPRIDDMTADMAKMAASIVRHNGEIDALQRRCKSLESNENDILEVVDDWKEVKEKESRVYSCVSIRGDGWLAGFDGCPLTDARPDMAIKFESRADAEFALSAFGGGIFFRVVRIR